MGPNVKIHVAKSREQYDQYWVNPIFGVPGEVDFAIPAPNRLVVRDVPLDPESEKELLALKTDLPFTEVKWEAAIDRVTAAAKPRQIERVPAGAVFSPMELVFSLYLPEDVTLFDHVLTCLQLVEDDYLGGQGSRGSGKVAFRNLTVTCKRGDTNVETRDDRFAAKDLADLIAVRTALREWLTLALRA
jgi:CRISPR-associated protein Csm3